MGGFARDAARQVALALVVGLVVAALVKQSPALRRALSWGE